MKNYKKISALALAVMLTFGCVFAITANKENIADASIACSHHIGNHYTEKSPSLLEGGTAEYYICCNCHNVILAEEHVAGDGDWTEKGIAPAVENFHRAYLEPTVTKAQVEEKLAMLESTVAIDSNPSAFDKVNYEKALKYKNAYMTKEGSVEADLIGIENLYGADNVLSYRKCSPILAKIDQYNIHARTREDITLSYDQKDEETGFEYTRFSTQGSLGGWDFIYYYQGSILKDLPDTPLQVLIRSNNEFYVSSAIHNGTEWVYGLKTQLIANKWTVITFTAEQVALIKSCGYNTGTYYQNKGPRIQIYQQTMPGNTVVDFTTFYTVKGLDLSSYNLISNENYHYGGLYNKGGVNVTLSTNLQSSNNWFKGVGKAENITGTTRNNFIELKYTHNNATDKNYSDFKYDSPDWLGNDVYSSLYFNIGSAFKKTVKEMFVMVYSNVETDIHMSNLFDICKKAYEPRNVLTNTRLYKGWNLLNFAIPENGLEIIYNSGTFFTVVPEVWKAGIELTITGLFYKEFTGAPADFSVKTNKDDAKIINFTDLHIHSADDLAEGSSLRKTLTTAMTEASPDLVTISGDAAWYEASMPENYILNGYQDLCNFMDTFEVPYFFTFGNHDREYATVTDLKAIIDNSKYGKIALSPNGVGHDVNYSIDIYNKNDELIHTLIIMDTGSYKGFSLSKLTTVTNPIAGVPYNEYQGSKIYGTYFYDNCDLTQVDWYENEISRILNKSDRVSNSKSSLVIHIPFIEYHFAFEKYQNAVNNADTETIDSMQLIGKNTMSGSGACGAQFGFFDKIKTLGNTASVTCGHDHKNSFSLLYDGVRLTYGVKTGAEYTGAINGYTKTSIASNGEVITTQNYIK